MKMILSQKEYDEIDRLVARVKGCSSKKAAESYLKQLSFLSGSYGGPVRNILSELISEARNACGNVPDVAMANHFLLSSLSKLERFIKNDMEGSADNE
jgi:hypothetical protein